MKHLVFFFLCLGISTTSYSQAKIAKEISGTITYLNEPLKDVNITIKGTSKGTKTNAQGEYSLQANVGDILEYSHVAYNTVAVMIEDVTSTLNIELQEKDNQLDEVVVKARKNQKALEYLKQRNRIIKTSVGEINLKAIGFSIDYAAGEDLPKHCDGKSDPLQCAANQQFPFLKRMITDKPPIWDVDGVITETAPFLSVNMVKHMWFLPNAPLRYGHKKVIIVQTISGAMDNEEKEEVAEQYRNQNYYSNDAITTKDETSFSSTKLVKTISGKVTHLFAPVPNVNITIKGTSKGTKTNDKGDYSLQANIGDILEYSHVSYKTVAVMVEDVTSTLNIELQEKDNQLDEVLVTAEKEKDLHEVMDIDLKTPFGTINPLASGYSTHYLDNKSMSRITSPSLEEALDGRFSNVKIVAGKLLIRGVPAKYIIDDTLYESVPAIIYSDIVHLFIIKEKALVIMRTKSAPEEVAKRQEALAEKYRNQNYYSNDAITTKDETSFSSTKLVKTISGKVTHLFAPIPNVNITIKGTSKGTKTNDQGEYSLQANVGDILEYSHVAYNTVAVMIEDVTSTLNIEMTEKVNELNEVVVKAKIKVNKTSELFKKGNEKFKTAVGMFNPRASGFSIGYIDGNDIKSGYPSLSDALNGKLAGVSGSDGKIYLRGNGPAIWDVDGQIFSDEPPISPSNVKEIYILKALGSTIRYGTIGRNGVIIVRTNSGSFDEIEAKKEEIAKQYQNQNYYSNDAVTSKEETTFSSTNIKTTQPKYIVTKDIHGKVTFLDAPMPLVNIKVVGKNSGVVTNPKGEYAIKANVGDIIQYSHVGFATVSIIVEDVTEVLDIEMVEEQNELETVIVTTDGKLGKSAQLAKKAEKKFKTSLGNIDPKSAGYSVGYINGDNSTAGARDILDVLDGKVAGVIVDRINNKVKLRSTGSINADVPPLWDVDGNVINYVPNIAPDNIKDIHLLKSLASTTRYGSNGRGGVIVVNTKSGDFSAEANKNKIAEQYTNQDYYSNDASQIALSSLNANSYADALEAFPTKQKAFIYYDEKLKQQLPSYADHIAIAQKFVSYFNDLTLSTQIFKDLIEKYSNNPEILKAIAYHLQTIGRPKEAIDAYERTFKLRPHYAQSYRDLANAYIENDQYKKGWRLYMSYLLQGHDVSGDGIGELIYNEMEWLFYSRRNQTDIKENFIPKSKNLFDFRNDVRIIVEWNSSEAEFDLEFVNPDLRSYVFEHTLTGNQELITNEKQKGYSSKEFFIDDLQDGEWLANITYKGNKKPEPTYFKITKFYNWGKANEHKEVAVYKFQNERDKIQLMRFTKDLLASTN